MREFIVLFSLSLLLGSCIAYETTYQNAYTFLDKGCMKQPLKIHTTVVDPQCSRLEDSPYSITFCDLDSQEYVIQTCGSDSTCSSSDCSDSMVYYANNCSYYDDYFHPNTEFNCTKQAPLELMSIPNTFAQVSFNNRKCVVGQEDIYDIKVYYLGLENCYDSYSAYNDYDSTYYTCDAKGVTQYTCRGPSCSKQCNVTATYDIGCDGSNGKSVQYICNPEAYEEPCLDGCPQKEEEPCLDGCPQKEEEPCLDGCPEVDPCLDGCPVQEEPCLDGCPAKEEEPCLDGCPEKEEEPCLDGCPEKVEEPCLDGCPVKEEPCLDGCPEVDPCLDGCPEKEEEPCLDGCPAKVEPCLDGCPEVDPCLDGCPEKEEEPCLDGCPEKEEEPCLDGCPEVDPCLDGCPAKEEEPCLDGCPAKEDEPCLDGCPEKEEEPCLDGCPI